MDRVRRVIEDARVYGNMNNVPIMSIDSINEIKKILNENNIKSILEIGTAIGYSTLCFAECSSVNRITSIERDINRYNIAVNNINKSGIDYIELICDDALNTVINDKYDLLIIDAAKSQNMKFFNKYKENLNEGGIIIIDNLDFHGFVGNSSSIKSRNLRQMVRKVERFINFLDNNSEYDVEYIEVGDRLGVCKRKNL